MYSYGMFQSYPIERRFGWYRQLSGGIYCITVNQILEAKKKNRILSLVKFSDMTNSEIKVLLDEDLVKAELILTNWQPDGLQELASNGESNAFYFVAGYIGFSLKKKISCTSCQELMVIRDTPPDSITFDSPTNQHVDLKEFINIMSRRGLFHSIRPSLPLLSLLYIPLHHSYS
ncbi:uncharacterized protein [Lepeophtheirus salmonis]|uniref:uncharacterized protein n=1 Tax=Lepeophtheirus salmonis TaxID=72036 RepID=UPI001AE6FBD5|nr:uncharacterized protein LOC121127215 [Lepeophtheirus salmonis]